jgi:hypothetical protein
MWAFFVSAVSRPYVGARNERRGFHLPLNAPAGIVENGG